VSSLERRWSQVQFLPGPFYSTLFHFLLIILTIILFIRGNDRGRISVLPDGWRRWTSSGGRLRKMGEARRWRQEDGDWREGELSGKGR
jgi:hypothetical protein